MLSSSHFCFYQSQLTLTAAHDNMFRNSYAARYRSDTPIRPWLEQALDFIDTDELVEITPKHIRLRKKILDPTARYRAKRNGKA